jgi:ArsR family transcriptional regulator
MTRQQTQTVQDNHQEPADSLASLNKAASDPLRLDVLRVLKCSSFGVMELCHILDTKQSALSHHLKILLQTELVATRREGNSIFYRRQVRSTHDPLYHLQQSLFGAIDELPLPATTEARIANIEKERSSSSAKFFTEHAADFKQQQELIATYSLYGDGVKELLLNSPLSDFETAIEVGPGNGEFLAELSPLFNRVIALDNSPEMLEHCKQYCSQHNLQNVEFLLTDTRSEPADKADCVVINMVLHHVASPAAIFHDLEQMLSDHGVIVLTELCSHNQDWTRDACGDVWLGFEPDDILQWAQDADLVPLQSVYQALRNGFQIQLHAFCKQHGSLSLKPFE